MVSSMILNTNKVRKNEFSVTVLLQERSNHE